MQFENILIGKQVIVNNETLIEIIGFLALTITNGAYVPQIWQMLKTKKVDDVNVGFCVAIVTGLSLWLIYGILKMSPALIVANSTGVIITGMMLTFKYVYGGKDGRSGEIE